MLTCFALAPIGHIGIPGIVLAHAGQCQKHLKRFLAQLVSVLYRVKNAVKASTREDCLLRRLRVGMILIQKVYEFYRLKRPPGWYARLRTERSGVEPGTIPWPGTLYCVLGQDTFLSQCLSPPRCINGYRRI